MKKQKYDIVVSVGAACLTSLYLRQNLLQKKTYPFDWVGGGSFLDRIKILCAEFDGYLELKDLHDTGKSYVDRIGPCKIVENQRNGIIFNHDFPEGISIEKSYPMVKERYDRRGKRLIKLMNSANKILVIYIEENNRLVPLKDNASLLKAGEMLHKKFLKQSIQLLYVSNDTHMLKGDKKDEQLSPEVRRITLNYQNTKNPNGWVPDWKELRNVLGYLRLKKPLGEFLYEKILLTLSYLIIFRAMRRKFLRKCHFYI